MGLLRTFCCYPTKLILVLAVDKWVAAACLEYSTRTVPTAVGAGVQGSPCWPWPSPAGALGPSSSTDEVPGAVPRCCCMPDSVLPPLCFPHWSQPLWCGSVRTNSPLLREGRGEAGFCASSLDRWCSLMKGAMSMAACTQPSGALPSTGCKALQASRAYLQPNPCVPALCESC